MAFRAKDTTEEFNVDSKQLSVVSLIWHTWSDNLLIYCVAVFRRSAGPDAASIKVR